MFRKYLAVNYEYYYYYYYDNFRHANIIGINIMEEAGSKAAEGQMDRIRVSLLSKPNNSCKANYTKLLSHVIVDGLVIIIPLTFIGSLG